MTPNVIHKPKMGRPKLPIGKALGGVFGARFRPDEAKAIRAAIDASGISQSNWIRRAILRQCVEGNETRAMNIICKCQRTYDNQPGWMMVGNIPVCPTCWQSYHDRLAAAREKKRKSQYKTNQRKAEYSERNKQKYTRRRDLQEILRAIDRLSNQGEVGGVRSAPR